MSAQGAAGHCQEGRSAGEAAQAGAEAMTKRARLFRFGHNWGAIRFAPWLCHKGLLKLFNIPKNCDKLYIVASDTPSDESLAVEVTSTPGYNWAIRIEGERARPIHQSLYTFLVRNLPGKKGYVWLEYE